MSDAAPQKSMDDIVALCKRRGFIFPASEIYGGLNGFWDYGPLGTELKNNLRDAWWQDMVRCSPPGPDGQPLSIVGLDSSIIQNPRVWEASGHVGGFTDPMQTCRQCKKLFRADHVPDLLQDSPWVTALATTLGLDTAGEYTELDRDALANLDPQEGQEAGPWTRDSAREGNGSGAHSWQRPVRRAGGRARRRTWLATRPSLSELRRRPDRAAAVQPDVRDLGRRGARRQQQGLPAPRRPAQGIFLNYKNVLDTMRVKVPFGIAQIGKAFRNEVTPRNFIFRSREFEQMELEWFCQPDQAVVWYEYWCEQRKNWWQRMGLSADSLNLRSHDPDELAHYAKTGAGTFDIEYRFPFTAPGFGELEGVAHRTDFDLTQHQEHSGTKLEYFDQERNERYMPHVIEPSSGLSRGVLALICEAFTPDPERPSKVFMKFEPRLAPLKAAVFPLVNKDGLPEVAHKLHADLSSRYPTQLDVKQTVGKRYARMDEAGTPFCFTIDSDTLTDQTVTVRHRDTTEQERIALDQVAGFLEDKLG